jgi:hypothetical protein
VVDHQRLSGAGYCFSDLHREFRTKSNNNVLTDADMADLDKEISGPQLQNKLRENISNLDNTLTNSCHPHALKLRNRLVITSHPESPILYLEDQINTQMKEAPATQ